MFPPDLLGFEKWRLIERRLDLDVLAETETLFALSNGHIGLRGNLDEGEPAGTPGTYLNGVYEVRPLPYAESSYGYPEEGQSMINVTDGKVIRLLVDDEPFDLRYGELIHHERRIDLRAGMLTREAVWVSPAGKRIRVRTARLVSFTERSLVAIAYQVTPLDDRAQVVVQSELVANEPVGAATDDPRAAAALSRPLVADGHVHNELHAALVHHTQESGLRVAAAMDHIIRSPDDVLTKIESEPDLARMTAGVSLDADEELLIVKFVAYGWSSERSVPALRDQADGALASAGVSGWDAICTEQREYLDALWDTADVEIDGDPELQLGVRYAVFQMIQAAARAERRAIPAKGLTGSGYDGHTFWDSETYTLRALSYLDPDAVRDALLWRHATMDRARDRARELNLNGVTFPWRTISGEESSGYWPASTAAFHINADVADAVRRYLNVTGDEEFERREGLELLVETARLWRSLGHHDVRGAFRIDGVTGPDEYTALCDNNIYTNLMAARNLIVAADAVERHPDRAEELGVSTEDIADWRAAAGAIAVPVDQELGITPQCDGFTRYRKWDFEHTPPGDYPLLMHHHNYKLYSSQVVKQADLVMALWTCGERFDAEQKARDFAFYEGITVRDSSLSAAIQAIVAAEVGHVKLAYEYLRETTLVDLRNLSGNTHDGLHLASLAGSWLAIVAGFGGLRDGGDCLAFAPRRPDRLGRIAFGLRYCGRRLRVTIEGDEARYELRQGEPLEILHHGEKVTVERDEPQTRRLLAIPDRPVPSPPRGREPAAPERTEDEPAAPTREQN